MKTIIKYYWITLTVILISSFSATAQELATPSETKKQAEKNLKEEAKRERERETRSDEKFTKGEEKRQRKGIFRKRKKAVSAEKGIVEMKN